MSDTEGFTITNEQVIDHLLRINTGLIQEVAVARAGLDEAQRQVDELRSVVRRQAEALGHPSSDAAPDPSP